MENLKTGTTTLGIVCKDGIVLAADKRTTAGGFIVRKDADKITAVNENIAITTAGTVSDIQLFIKLLRSELKLKRVKSGRNPTVKEAANLASRMMYEGARQYFQSLNQVILAGFDKEGTHIYDLEMDGAMIEVKEYVSTGSGSILVYGILENSFKDGISVKDAEELAIKCVTAAIQRDAASGNGIDVMVVTSNELKKTVQKKTSMVPA